MTRHARLFSTLVLAGLALVVSAASARAAGDPNGTWKWSFTTQSGQEFEFALDLKQDGEKLTGSLSLPNGNSVDIKDGTFKKDEVAFAIEFERNGNTMTVKYKGKVDGDTIKGKSERERNGETMSRDWEAKREKKA
jgi:hypothetical protein